MNPPAVESDIFVQVCEKCGSRGHGKEATKTSYGVRRRYYCTGCDHRWTRTFTPEEDAQYKASPHYGGGGTRRLDPALVRQVLVSDEPSRQAAAHHHGGD